MSDLTRSKFSLSQKKLALLELLLQEEGIQTQPALKIGRRANNDPAPLSFAQQRLWFLDQFQPNSPVYNLPIAIPLSGHIDYTALEQSLYELVKRHEALRTVFAVVDGQPVQVVQPAEKRPIPLIDLSHIQPEEHRRANAIQLANEEALTPFNLAQGPLLRLTLLRLAHNQHTLLLTIHHIISDAWSMDIMIREMMTLYGQLSAGQPVSLPPLPLQYADFATWQRNWLQGDVLETQLAYWRKQLQDAPPYLDLPTDHPRPPQQTFHGRSYSAALPPALAQQLNQLSHQEGVTLFMVLLAAFKTLLYRYTGQGDMVVGTPVANRHHGETEGLIGFFVNTLVLRTQMEDAPTFRHLLQRVRQVMLDAQAHQDLPFEKLVEVLQPERHMNYTPLFQVVFTLQTQTGPSLPQNVSTVTHSSQEENGISRFDLTLFVLEQGNDLTAVFEYNTDLFDRSTIERMMGHFHTLLTAVVATPACSIAHLPLLTTNEKQQLAAWNNTYHPYPPDVCVHQLVEAQAQQRPHATAAVYGNRTLTYSQLDRQATHLAGHLQQMGVKPGSFVGLCVERSLDMLVGSLAILKAGAAYVPLDPAYPAERLAFMMADSQMTLVLTQSWLVERLPEGETAVFCLDAPPKITAVFSHTSQPTAHHLAYLIYTSGSTGQPKGVPITHQSLHNLITWHQKTVNLAATDRTTQIASLSFDASVWEIWPPLAAGASLYIPPDDLRANPPQLRDWLVEQQISLSFLPTPLAEAVLDLPWPASTHLRALLTGGDTLHKTPPPNLPFSLVNNYGPTENTVITTFAAISSNTPISIGRPIQNTQVYLLDRHLEQLPVGVPGELCIGGDGLTQGYLNRPALTAEKFIPNPFSQTPGARLYRTGDLAKYRPDGSIEFLGRIDYQVKVRGFRIELGEIESLLNQHPLVNQTIVLSREDTPGDKRLVAYVASSANGALTPDDLRTVLQQKLPEYMLPAAFVILETFPLTTNGKINRRALPAPEYGRSQEFIAPRTPTEQTLAAIWCQLLPQDRISIHDNFFQLGGHSLLAAQVIGRIRETFHIDVPLRDLFQEPTLASLAAHIEETQRTQTALQLPPITPADRNSPLPLSFSQQRIWFLEELEPGVYNVPTLVPLQLSLDVAALEHSFNCVIERHEILRTTFPAVDGNPIQRIAPTLKIPVSLIDLRQFSPDERTARAKEISVQKSQQPFDLAQGPLFRVALIQLEDEDYWLLLNMHHIIADAWSAQVFTQELLIFYRAFVAHQPSPLPPLPIQFADFAVWQRQWLQGDALQTQLNYWKTQLGSEIAVVELPTDHPRPAVMSFRGTTQSFDFPAPLAQAIKTLARQQGTTLFILLLAAFKVLLYRYSRQSKIVVGSPISNRRQKEVEGLIGFFLNTLVLQTDLSGNLTFHELLERVREVTLGAYAHQDLPFERLVEELQPGRDLSRTPLFQVMFVFKNNLTLGLETGLDAIPVNNKTSKFDLTLFVSETAESFIGSIEYSTDLFEAETITRLWGHFQTLLAGIVANPHHSIETLPLLTTAETALFTHWNQTQTTLPATQGVHHLFEAQAQRTPHALAVTFQEESLTYQQLDQQASQLAHYLQSQGVKPNSPVAICMERSLEMAVGILGILKAGGGYLPLDPAYPSERLAFMLADSGASFLLTQQSLKEMLPCPPHLTTICLDADHDSIRRQPQTPPDAPITADSLLYLIYTSGSTGLPKGVAMPHSPLTNLIHWQTNHSCLDHPARTLQFSPISFDVSCQELFFTWHSGGTLVLIPETLRKDPAELLNLLQEAHIERLFLPFIALQHLAETAALLHQPPPSYLKEVITAGEQLQITPQIAAFFSQLPSCTLHNQYGPTECHVATAFTLPTTPETWMVLPPIGRPIANAMIHILNPQLQRVPVGVPGELYIGGVPLARGYLNRPNLTAEKFVPDPFNPTPGARMYRTGDLAKYGPDGDIEFLGRADHQVKVRGYRIEPGEVEAVLNQHPGLETAVIAINKDTHNHNQLVAYFVPNQQNPPPSTTELSQFLRQTLPDYMVPALFVPLPTLPLTPSGKIDRKSLPAPAQANQPEQENYSPPRNSTEELIANILAELLGRDKISVHANFFDLGGHSLLITRAVSRLRQTFSIEFPLSLFFADPTIAGLADQINKIKTSGQTAVVTPIQQVIQQNQLPLSYAQERLWFLNELEPNSPFYNIPFVFHLGVAVNVPALEQSLTELIRRHEILRTTFSNQGGTPFQLVHPPTPHQLEVVNLQNLDQEKQEQTAWQLAHTEANTPFNLQTGPLLRTKLLCLGEQNALLLLTLHHIIADGWSKDILLSELLSLYEAFVAGQPSPLPELPIQYADFAAWQREWLQGEVLEQQMAYWRNQLAGSPPHLELPTDHPRPPYQTYRGSHCQVVLNPELSATLRQMSKQQNSTLFMTLLAAFDVLLYRYSGQQDILLGTPIANRNRAEIEGLIGFFVNTLVLRNQVTPHQTFLELLEQVRQTALEAYAHQDVPFEKLVEELQPERHLNHSPLFQVMFTFDATSPSSASASWQGEGSVAKFDLTLAVQDSGETLTSVVEFNTDLFEKSTILRLLGHWQTLLEGIIAHPNKPICQLPLLTADELHQLATWNDTFHPLPDDLCLHQLFEAQVQQTPHAIAVRLGDSTLTYQQLNQQANQLAHHLQQLGVAPDVPVALFLPRSLDMVVALLAVLKAGGVYLPLDTALPPDRLSFMLLDVKPVAVISHQALVPVLPSFNGHVLALDALFLSDLPTSNPVIPLSPQNLAYLIFTSGSTGSPKAVAVQHAAIVAHCLGVQQQYLLTAADRVLQFAAFTFDPSLEQLFPPLSCGATVLLRGEHLWDVMEFWAFVQAEAVTVANLPTAYWQLFLQADAPLPPVPALRLLLVGGEAMSAESLRLWRQLPLAAIRLLNAYGPTEAVITTLLFDTAVPANSAVVPVGKPLSNRLVYILDKAGYLAPVGVPGELCIGGELLARGYLNRPGLTAEKFTPNPFTSNPGSRLYHTGDLAKYRPDGTIEFLGRIDHQVKIRGFRVELGEIEATLRQYPAVQETAVIIHHPQPDNPRLIAYLTSSTTPFPTDDLRRFLKEKLPNYMLPSAIIPLETLPLTPNGKLDRRALPLPHEQHTRPDKDQEYTTPTQETLRGIWTELLGQAVGLHDNFFDIGGHSLLATRLISRIREAFHLELPLRLIFEAPTIALFAQHLSTTHQHLSTPSITPIPRQALLPLSYAQERLWFLNELEPNNPFYNIPFVFHLGVAVDVPALEQSLTELIRRHEILRTTFSNQGGTPFQLVHPPTPHSLTTIDLSHLLQEEQEQTAWQLAHTEANTPFNLQTGPLLRTKLLCLGEQNALLLLTLHHIIADGWSKDILLSELLTLYEAFVAGQPSPLLELPIQYADFAAWQREWLQGEVLETQMAYWRNQLAGSPPHLELPTDHPRPPYQTYRGSHCQIQIGAELAIALRQMSKQNNSTLFMTLLAAFDVLLYRYSGQQDILLGTPIANRNRAEIEGLIGFFVNTLVLRTRLQPSQTFVQLLEQVRQTALEAYAHQDVPFEKLVEELQPERHLNHSPLFQVMFTFDATSPSSASASWQGEGSVAKFDLTLAVQDSGETLTSIVEFNTDLFEKSTIQRLLGHWQVLLQGIVAHPDTPICQLPLLTADELHQLATWNDTFRPLPSNLCLHHLFEQQVQRSPQAVAVRLGDNTLTYEALNQQANQLAHHLQQLGVAPDVPVALFLPRSLDMVVALLAVLKAGGVYLPLDTALPPDRLSFMLLDVKPAAVITLHSLAAALGSYNGRFLHLDAPPTSLSLLPATNPPSPVSPQNLAYLIFTSGSTGSPKAVAVQHSSLLNYLNWVNEVLFDGEVSYLPTTTKLTFDASLKQLFPPLMKGEEIWLLEENISAQVDQLVQNLGTRPKVSFNGVPSLWKAILDQINMLQGEGRAIPCITHLLLGGEAFSQELVKRSFDTFPDLKIWNLYGPSEATANASAARITPSGPITIGQPIANTQLFIVDRSLNLVPIGVPGELCIGGELLARGYLNRPGLTAEKFTPNPFTSTPGSRLYHTGDLAKYRPDGTIEFLGRIDHQVKIRGFRVELGEIEATLRQYPAVQETAVIIHHPQPDNPRLIAYLTSSTTPFPTDDLRRFLKEKLPNYMLPSAIIPLETLPLTPNGKLDRRALPLPHEHPKHQEKDLSYTPTQETLRGIWTELLGQAVGLHDNFFDIGGHSLLATRLISRIREAFHLELPLRLIFEAPTIALFAQHLSITHQQLSTPSITSTPRQALLPLSYAQERLWFLNELEPNSPFYNIPFVFHLGVAVNVPALEQSLTELIRRHEILRTTFSHQGGTPFQLVHSPTPHSLTTIDLSHLLQEEQEQAAWQLAHTEANTPFNLQTGPLLRTKLLCLGEQNALLLLTLHHIIADGWSKDILLSELLSLYEAFVAGQPSPLPELPIQYADFAAWQREWLQGEVLEQQMAYWRNQLAGSPPHLELPTDHPRPPYQTYRGSHCQVVLNPELSATLRQMSKQQNSTLFMTLLAAFDVLLYRYSGQQDILLGTPIANRNRAEIEGLIGFFVNTLVLRNQVTPHQTFLELLEQVRQTALEAYAHQDVPFEKLVEELQPERHLNHSPLFQVMFTFDATSPSSASASWQGEGSVAKFDLTLAVQDSGETLTSVVEFNTDLFEKSTILRLLGHWQTLLEGIIAHPNKPICQLPLLTADELHQLATWNDTFHPLPDDLCLHQLFEAQVQQTPHAIAVRLGDSTLTYQQLNQQANQLAHHLQQLGVAPDVPVALFLPRSLDMVVALLAVLKAGGVYLPLDTALPPDRLSFMLLDVKPVAVISHQALVPVLPSFNGHVLALDALFLSDLPTSNPVIPLSPQNLAYLIFTSGSTGSPKAVAVQHAAIVAHCLGVQQQYLLTAADRVLQFAAFTFDPSLEQLFPPLSCGATVLLRGEHLWDVMEFWAFVQAEAVTVANLPTAYWQLFLQADAPLPPMPSLRLLLVGGEAMSAESLRLWRQLPLAAIRLLNAYGPTEAVITTLLFDTAVPANSAVVPVGKPLSNRLVYILDKAGYLAPVGVPGELCIGGELLARGYLNRPGLTAEKFTPNPFTSNPGSRLYHTGDLAKYRPDGTIEFLGRIDHQVKIRGFRVELGEIEATINQLPHVQQSLVLVREDVPGDKRLIAYVVPQRDSAFTIESLQQFVQQKLPNYMVPSAYILLETFPLMPNGKINRHALPAPKSNIPTRFTTSKTPTEEAVAAIWSQVLAQETISSQDNFFQLGGHSLMAVQVISRIRQAFQIELPLRELFQQPTLSALASRIQEIQRQNLGLPLPPPSKIVHGDTLPLSFSQERLWFLEQLEPGVYNIPSAIYIQAPLDTVALTDAFNQLIQRHEMLRATFPAIEGQPTQMILPSLVIHIPLTDLRHLPQHERREYAQQQINQERWHPFDLAKGPLLQAQLFQLDEAAYLLFINMHHIITDAWSSQIFSKELALFYQAAITNTPLSLPPLPRYTDFAIWQRQWLQGEVLETQLNYWKKQLGGELPVIELPLDRPRPPVMSSRGANVSLALPAHLAESFKLLVRQEGNTLFMGFLAAFKLLLYRYGGQPDIVVGSPISNRQHQEFEGVIGFFLNTLVLRTNLSGNPGFREVLTRVRDVALDAYAHQDLPFERLVEELQPERNLSRTPLFQVMFVLQMANHLSVEGFGDVSEENQVAKFDLSLLISETADSFLITIQYRTDLFDASTITQMLQTFQELLAYVANHPEQPIDNIPLPIQEPRPRPTPQSIPAPMALEKPVYLPPRDSLEQQLGQIWQELLGQDSVGVQDDFFQSGGHSLLAVRFVAKLRKQIGQPLSLATFFQNPTIERLAGVLRQQATPAQPSSLVELRAAGNGRPLFFIHPVGGNVVCYAQLAHHLTADLPIYGIQAYGLSGEAEPLTGIEQMATHYLTTLRSTQPNGPYRLGGWSMGGVVAFEMAQRLQAQGEAVELLVLLDSHLPQTSPAAPRDSWSYLLAFGQDMGLMSEELGLSPDELQELLPDKQLAHVLQAAQKAGKVPADIELAQAQQLFSVFKANVQAWEQYRPHRPFFGRTVLFQPQSQLPETAVSQLTAWQTWIEGQIAVHQVPGDHYTMLYQPQVTALAEQLGGYFA